MKSVSLLTLLLLTACAAVPNQAGPDAHYPETRLDNRVTVYLGQRNLDEDDYRPVDEQGTFGIEFAHESTDSAVGWEFGLMGSAAEETAGGFDIEGRTGELYGGVRKTLLDGSVHPYIGGGVAYITSEVEVIGVGEDDDSSVAGYAHIGVTADITPAFFLGLDLRVLFGSDLTISGLDTDADYGQLAVMLGWAF